jgi:hypothetical protein
MTEVFKPEVYSLGATKKVINKLPNISFSKINPTEYSFSVVDAKAPFVLEFVEGFSPFWELYIEDDKLKDHTIINGYSNGWLIDKQGSYSGKIIFKTQKLFEVGIVITAASVIGFIIFGLFQLVKYVKRK